MGKGVMPTGIAAALATASIPTIALTSDISNNKKENKPAPKQPTEVPDWAKKLIDKFDSATDIKSKHKDIECLKVYGDSNGNNEWEDLSSKQSSNKPQFTLTDIESDDIKGCLMVEYHERTYKHEKRRSNFSLVLSIGDNKKEGLVIVLRAKINNRKISMDYAAYFLTSNNKKWNITHKQETSGKEITEQSEVSKLFPEPGIALTSYKDTVNWGLDLKIEKICKDSECPENEKVSFLPRSNIWDWKDAWKTNKMHEWNKDFTSWFNSLFSGWEGIESKLESFQGVWYKRT